MHFATNNIRRTSKWPIISVIVLTYNNYEKLCSCLNSIFKSNYPNLEIIVLDNNSKDGTSNLIKKDYPGVRLITLKSNSGIASINIGIKASRGEYVSYLNDDAIIDNRMFNDLMEVMQDDIKIGIATGTAIEQRPSAKWCAGGFIDKRGIPFHCNYSNKITEVEWAFPLLFRRRMIEEVGDYYPNDYFFYSYDDIDFSYRVRQMGYKVVYVPSAIFWHYGGASTKGRRKFIIFYNRNRIRFILRSSLPQQLAAWLILEVTKPRVRALPYLLLGLIWNLPALFRHILSSIIIKSRYQISS